jgi:hypothetical protein
MAVVENACYLQTSIILFIMEVSESPVDQLITHAEDYLKTRQQLTQHVITEKVVVLTSTLIAGYMLFALFAMSALFASFGLANWISARMQDPFAGYWIVAGGYFFIGLIALLVRNAALKNPLMNAMVRNIYNEKNHGRNN